MRLLPKSLFGRLALVLLGVLVTAQLLSAYVLLRDRGRTLYETIRGDLVERTAGIARLLDAVAPEQRHRLLPLFNTPGVRVRLAQQAVNPASADPDGATVKAIERALQARLSWAGEVRVDLEDELAPADGPPRDGFGPRHRPPGHGRMGGPWAYVHGVNARARGFFVQVRLSDGNWVQFERRIPEDLFDQPTRLLLILALLLISVVLVSLLAVRWTVRPLRNLRRAADELGRDIQRPALDETGPTEVRETARAFNTMQQRIRSYVEDRSRILAAVSHDLKTPLTRLRLRTELLEDGGLKEKFQADLDDMEAMVLATLDFMRGTESREPTVSLDLMALLESIRDDAQDAGWNVQLEGTLAGPVSGRPNALKRCIVNLVENAARYAGGAEVRVGADAEAVKISVADRGPGIPEELLEKVFDPFFRLESSRARHTGGTGLGLGIARNIARAHGGDLVLRRRDAGGLVAELRLPSREAG